MIRLRHADRLVAGPVLGAVLLVGSTLLGFDAMLALASTFDDIGRGDYGIGTGLLQVLYTVPRRAYDLFPTAAMIGCVLGLGSLAGTSELTALRAAGVSRLRICLGAALPVLVLTLLMVASGETLAPWGERKALALQLSATRDDLALAERSGIWAREGDTFLNARGGRVEGDSADARVVLQDVQLYRFDPEGRLLSLTAAEQAVFEDGHWTLHRVHRAVFEARRVVPHATERERWDSRLTPEILQLSIRRPRQLPTRELRESLDYMRRNQLDPGSFEVAYWARIFYPLHALALCLCAMPFAFGTLRTGGLGKRLFLGVVLGLGYFLLQRLGIDLAQIYRVDLRLANLALIALITGAATLYFRRRH
ncbi:MAG: LPS export ABC transporter permease LptG [Lysobacteraceae bacterium]|nr:MAG: LPS export ABC transporter permease LptG [Xanthomonadaceae bacterium]